MKTYLTTYSQQSSLAEKLMLENNTEFLSDVNIVDIEGFLDLVDKYDNYGDLLYQTLLIVKKNSKQLKFYKNVEDSIEFAQQLLSALKVLESNEVEVTSYPVDDEASADVAFLLIKMKERTYCFVYQDFYI